MTPNEWADFWRYQISRNVLPADSKEKQPKVTWKKWQTEVQQNHNTKVINQSQ
jgi:hypothetical protein